MTNEDILKLGELAKIHIKPEEIESFKKDFESILSYVKQIESVEVGDIKPNFFLKNITRSDKILEQEKSLAEELVLVAPQKHDGFVKVNKII